MKNQVFRRFRRVCSSQGQSRYFSSVGSSGTGVGDYYLEETIIPTYHFQDSLPKLPIPKLEETYKKFEYFAKPISTSASQYESTISKAKAFFLNDAKSLQEALISRDKSVYSSFISKPWYDMYLKGRDPIAINVNPQLTFNFTSQVSQAKRAASLVFSSLKFYKTLTDKKLSPDIFHTKPQRSETQLFKQLVSLIPKRWSFYGAYVNGAYPLDMSQYERLFSSTRIPRLGKDELKSFTPQQSTHIVVQRGNDIYTVRVLSPTGDLVSLNQLEAAFDHILKDSSKDGAGLGSLTSEERDKWAVIREELVGVSERNKENMKYIDSALFAICLEDEKPESFEDISSCMLHGKDGSNRWFDKSFQLIVTGNAKAAVNFEHSWGDGVAVLRYFNMVWNDVEKGSSQANTKSGGAMTPTVEKLKFDVTPNLTKAVEAAKERLKKVIGTLDLCTANSGNLSKDICKKHSVGLDGVLQLCFQLGYYKLFKEVANTYESASTSAFKHGRTETIRSCTAEAKNFVELATLQSSSNDTKRKALVEAVKQHGTITKNALMGQGIDRHMFALKNIAQESGKYNGAVEAFYEDSLVTRMGEFILSTSTLTSPALFAGGFGPVNAKCFAVAYGNDKQGFRAALMSYKRGSKEYAKSIEDAAAEMKHILDSASS